jgi:hypothetical protein
VDSTIPHRSSTYKHRSKKGAIRKDFRAKKLKEKLFQVRALTPNSWVPWYTQFAMKEARETKTVSWCCVRKSLHKATPSRKTCRQRAKELVSMLCRRAPIELTKKKKYLLVPLARMHVLVSKDYQQAKGRRSTDLPRHIFLRIEYRRPHRIAIITKLTFQGE